MNMQSIWCYTIVRNEELLMPYFIRHYGSICSKIIVYDDDSTDCTREIVLSAGGIVRQCPWSGLDDIKSVAFATEQYKEARNEANWVIWVDADEFVYHPRLADRLEELTLEGVALPKVVGFSMVAENPPSGHGQIYDEIRMGFPDKSYSKPCVFDPSLEIVWTPGKHEAYTDGSVSNLHDPLKLLHYRYMGSNWHIDRNYRNYERLDPINIARKHGQETYPGYTGDHSPQWYEQHSQVLIDCLSE
ncbi:MAG TPA: glycosyltransferase family 2 protein [Ktedonobacteraceae bacterium]|nr:glycosyltransferase family 2 protein [Ktedonobacteraceae bacterium]